MKTSSVGRGSFSFLRKASAANATAKARSPSSGRSGANWSNGRKSSVTGVSSRTSTRFDMTAGFDKKTGYCFSDPALLETALTHSSTQGGHCSNERLEFLGDRVLGLVVA